MGLSGSLRRTVMDFSYDFCNTQRCVFGERIISRIGKNRTTIHTGLTCMQYSSNYQLQRHEAYPLSENIELNLNNTFSEYWHYR